MKVTCKVNTKSFCGAIVSIGIAWSVCAWGDSIAVSPEFFGMHIHRALRGTSWPSVRISGWRLWDAGVSWSDLEPVKGQWNFKTLDAYVELARKNGVEILLPFGKTPTWASARPSELPEHGILGAAAEPKDMDDWKTYVRTIATRYKGKIRNYEIWNEPNLKMFFSGSVMQMVAMARVAYQIIKEVDPSATVVSPAPTAATSGPKWLEEYFEKGGGQFADVIGYHFYVMPGSPEDILPLVSRVRTLMMKHGVGSKPLWNTESGWDRRKNFSNDSEAAGYVARSLILGAHSGISRFYWYAWDNTNWVGLRLTRDDQRTLTPAGQAFGEVQEWLVGSQITRVEDLGRGRWLCEVFRRGRRAWIVWSDSPSVFVFERGIKPRTLRRLSGQVERGIGNEVAIDVSPILLEE